MSPGLDCVGPPSAGIQKPSAITTAYLGCAQGQAGIGQEEASTIRSNISWTSRFSAVRSGAVKSCAPQTSFWSESLDAGREGGLARHYLLGGRCQSHLHPHTLQLHGQICLLSLPRYSTRSLTISTCASSIARVVVADRDLTRSSSPEAYEQQQNTLPYHMMRKAPMRLNSRDTTSSR